MKSIFLLQLLTSEIWALNKRIHDVVLAFIGFRKLTLAFAKISWFVFFIY